MTFRLIREQWAGPGGGRELVRLAWPLIITNGIWTAQITLDRVLLNQSSSDDLAASLPAVMVFWTVMNFFYHTVGYAATFVAQYIGAGRPHRVGPAIGQSLYVAAIGGIVFLLLAPFSDRLVALFGHDPEIQEREAIFIRCLCIGGLPALVTVAANSFFTGRGETRTVLLVMTSALTINGLLDYAWIFGHWGFPAWGIAGAGWATVCGSCTSAALALGLMLRPKYRKEFATADCWRFEASLFVRLLKFGLPNGLLTALDALAFTVFCVVVGMIGKRELAASNVAFTLNVLVFLPAMGIGQAVEVLVGRRLGEDDPATAARSTNIGFALVLAWMTAAAFVYAFLPGALLWIFHNSAETEITQTARVLLRFVAVYTIFDGANLVYSYALRGAGDTRFVTLVAIGPGWLVMVLPAYLAHRNGWGLYWAWSFASAYVALLALIFVARFWQGKWKSMRVIEPVVVET